MSSTNKKSNLILTYFYSLGNRRRAAIISVMAAHNLKGGEVYEFGTYIQAAAIQ